MVSILEPPLPNGSYHFGIREPDAKPGNITAVCVSDLST